MHDMAEVLLTLGGLFLVGLVTDLVGRHTPLPRVTLLLFFGFLAGPSALDVLPDLGAAWFPAVADVALVMVGFLLGGSLTLADLREHGRDVLWISIAEVVVTAAVVFAGLVLVGVRPEVALLLGAIATSTDPAATADVAREARARGRFTRTLLGVVAVDDAWGLVVFSLLLAAAQALVGHGSPLDELLRGGRELGGAVLLGTALGVPMAYLTGRIRPGEPTLVEALGMVLLCGGLALWLEVSFLLAAMVLGTVVANLARHHTRPFHAIEGIEWPFMILFFVLAGASLRLESVKGVAWLLCAYILLRLAGRLLGSWLGGAASGAGPATRRWMGAALVPQAGIAVGTALVASRVLPEVGREIVPVAVAAIVVFEAVGPVLTRLALVRTGEAQRGRP